MPYQENKNNTYFQKESAFVQVFAQLLMKRMAFQDIEAFIINPMAGSRTGAESAVLFLASTTLTL